MSNKNQSETETKTNRDDSHVEVVLIEPEIPQNTGSIARTCAALGIRLNLIEPLGFSLEDRYLRRAGLDYWPLVEVKIFPNLDAFFQVNPEGRFLYFTKKVEKRYDEADYSGRVYLLFGKETRGLPEDFIDENRDNCFRIPMRTETRSLNLSNAVSIVAYEAFRRNGFPGLS